MSGQSAYENSLCEEFIKNPKINPIDGKRLIYGKGPYLGYVALCKVYNYDVNHLLSAELTEEHYGARSRSPSRSRSPPRSPVRTIPLRPTENVEITPVSRSPVRSVPLHPTISASRAIPYGSVESEETIIQPAPPISLSTRSSPSLSTSVESGYYPTISTSRAVQPISPVRSLSTLSSSPLSIPVVRGPSIPVQYSEHRETIGRETFDPDPVTTVTRVSSPPVRTTVRGPYGPGGAYVNTTGVYKAPDQLQYTTYDYPEHEVVRGTTSRTVINNSPVRPVYSSRTETIGEEKFDPDPVTQVIEEQSRSFKEEVIGPYGPNGENVRISGIHTIPGQRRYITTDIPNHTVRSNYSPASISRTYSNDIY